MNQLSRIATSAAVALAGLSMAGVVALARLDHGADGHAAELTVAIPWAFGVAGVLSLIATYLNMRAARKGTAELERAAAEATDWTEMSKREVQTEWWHAFKADVERKRARQQQPDVEGWWMAQHDRLAHDGLHTTLSATLIVVGIVFTFMGVRDSAEQLRAALQIGAETPRTEATRDRLATEQGKSSKEMQKSIGAALKPLQEAFGANLVGIVFALGLMLGTGWLRHERRSTLEALRRCLLDDIEPMLDAEWDRTKAEARQLQAQALADQLLTWQTASMGAQAEAHGQLLVVLRELAATAKGARQESEFERDKLASLDETMRGLADHVAQRLTTQLAPILREQLEPSLAALAQSLQAIAKQTNGTAHEVASAAVNAVADQVRANYDAALEKLTEVVAALDDWSSTNLRALRDSSESLRASAMEQQSSFRLATAAFDGLRTVMPDLQEVVTNLDSVVTTTHALLRQGEEGYAKASEGQRQAAAVLATNSSTVADSLAQLQSLPAHVRSALDASAKHIEGVLARSDTEAQARLQAMQSTIDMLAERQASQAATTQQSIREFAEQMGGAVAQVVERARSGLGDASAQVAEQLQNLVERSGDSVATSAEDLSATLATGIGDLQTSFGAWREALTAMSAAVQTQAVQQEQRFATASRALEATATALRQTSDVVQKLPVDMNNSFRSTNAEFQQQVAKALGGLHVGVDNHLSKSVELLAAATQNLEGSVRQLAGVAKGLEQTASRLTRA